MQDDWEFFGGSKDELKIEDTDFYLHPNNWLAFQAFAAVETQWVLTSKDQRYALDYARAEIAWQKLGFDISGPDFDKVQYLEKLTREAV